jgi:hypothetical protein
VARPSFGPHLILDASRIVIKKRHLPEMGDVTSKPCSRGFRTSTTSASPRRPCSDFMLPSRRTETGTFVASTDATKFMMDAYPPAVRKWIKNRGGLTNQMIFLSGSELAAFVPSCPPGTVAPGFGGLSALRLFSQ